ncbi:hypothetical protein [Salipaludibacillus sp. CF4.18]|uniref:hypothetical protein n=1 Tax=Salipaludibacillus sp. CF4.18 TaxID=3373081 RepID=UPI003EE44A1D
MLLEQLHTQRDVEKYFNNFSRIDNAFADPAILNKISSSKQMAFFFEIAHRSNMGHIQIKPIEWMSLLSTSYDVIAKYVQVFIDLGILTKISKYNYYFTYFKDYSITSGYIHTYSFLYSEEFRKLSINSQRIAIYFLGLLSKRAPYKKEKDSIVMIQDWFGSADSDRLFPVWSRSEIMDDFRALTPFFDLILPSKLRKNRLVLKRLFPNVFHDRKTSAGREEWMARFLIDHGVESWAPCNLRDMTNMFQSMARNMTPYLAIEIFSNALIKVRLSVHTQSDAQDFLDLFHEQPKEVDGRKKCLMIFKDTFLKESVTEIGLKLDQDYHSILDAKKRIDVDLCDSPQPALSDEELLKLIDFEYDAIRNKCISFEKGLIDLFVNQDRKQLLTTRKEHLPRYVQESLTYLQKLAKLSCFEKLSFAKDSFFLVIEDLFQKEEDSQPRSKYPGYNWLEEEPVT